MPILHSQIAAQGKGPDGEVVQVPPATGLHMRGPIVQVTASIDQNAAKVLLAQGKTVPNKAGFALIDTGASNTCIDEQAARDLGLPVIDVGSMQSASHEKHPCNIYPVQIVTPVVTLNSMRTMGANLDPRAC